MRVSWVALITRNGRKKKHFQVFEHLSKFDLYRVDGLAIVKSKSGAYIERIYKKNLERCSVGLT